jgi:hypothetical protein
MFIKTNNQKDIFYSYAILHLKAAYHFLKDVIYSSATLSSILDKRIVKKGKEQENRCLNYLKEKGYPVYDVKAIYDQFKHEKYKTCHIIGGGWSLNHSIDKIDCDDFVIGMNYAALAEIKFDLYFIEQGLCDENETRLRVDFLDNVISKQAKKIYFKNTYGPYGMEYVMKNYAGKVNFLRSFAIHCSNEKNLSRTMESLLEYDPKYMRQYRSTIISSIAIAKNIGFKKIVIHGLDFGGKYFYEETLSSKEKRKYLPPPTSLSVGGVKHQTVSSACGADKAVVKLNKLLQEDDVILSSGCIESPLFSLLLNK